MKQPAKFLPRIVVALTADNEIADLIRSASGKGWSFERAEDWSRAMEPLRLPNIRLVIVDDEVFDSAELSWAIAKVRNRAPGAPLLYIAGRHDTSTELRARTSGAQYYFTKPPDPAHFRDVLSSFMRAK